MTPRLVPPSPDYLEDLGDQPRIAETYHKLGIVTQEREQWMTPRTGISSPWPSKRTSATAPPGRDLPPARHDCPGTGAAR